MKAGRQAGEAILIRLSPEDAARLDSIKDHGGYPSRSSVVRSIVLAVLDDDRAAHKPQLRVVK